MHPTTSTQNLARCRPLLPLAAVAPAIVCPVITTAGGKGLSLVFLGCWLLFMAAGLSFARKQLGVALSRVVTFLLGFTGLFACAVGAYLR